MLNDQPCGHGLVVRPVGADLYLLKFILHDWDDESYVKILRNCRTAVIDAAGEPGLAELQDMNMLVATDFPLSVIEAVAA